MTKTPSDLAKRVTKLREMGGISARALSVLAGLSPSFLGQLERGEFSGLGAESAMRIAAVLGVSVDHLIHGSGDPPSADRVLEAVRVAGVLRSADPKPKAKSGKAAA